MVAESVLEGSNGWQQMWLSKKLTLRVTVFGANRKNEKWPHIDDIINNMARKL